MAAMFVGNGPAAVVKAPIVKAPAATQAAIAALRRILIPGPFLLTTPGAPFGRPGDRTNNLRTGGPVPAAQALAAGGRTRSRRKRMARAPPTSRSKARERAWLVVVVVGILGGPALVEEAEGGRPEISLIAVDPIDQDAALGVSRRDRRGLHLSGQEGFEPVLGVVAEVFAVPRVAFRLAPEILHVVRPADGERHHMVDLMGGGAIRIGVEHPCLLCGGRIPMRLRIAACDLLARAVMGVGGGELGQGRGGDQAGREREV